MAQANTVLARSAIVAALATAAALTLTFCTPAPALAAPAKTLAQECKETGDKLGALLDLVRSAKSDAEIKTTANILSGIAQQNEAGTAAVNIVLQAHREGLSPKFLAASYTTSCKAGII